MRAAVTARPSRTVVGLIALGALSALLALDAAQTPPVDLFNASPALALGSGLAPEGAHCSGG